MSDCSLACPHGEFIPRDRWERPVVEGRARQRVSTRAKALDDQGNLITWTAGEVAYGVSLPISEDLRQAAQMYHGDSKRMKEEVVEPARARSGSDQAARRGSVLHEVVARWATGAELGEIDQKLVRSVELLAARLEELRLTVVYSEQFVVNERWGVAGTFDLGLRDEDGDVFCADLKTGAKSWERTYPGAVTMQIAAYAGGRRWCPRNGWLPAHGMRVDRGLLISLPVDKQECSVDVLDLDAGNRGLELATGVVEWRKKQPRAIALA